jgi:hypothetical protein
MAQNYSMRIDLLKIKGAFMRNLTSPKTGVTKRCLIIAVDDAEGMFLGEKGCYLNMTAVEMKEPKFNDTHCIKPDLPKEIREAMTEEQKKAVPILGGLHAIEPSPQAQMAVTGTLDNDVFQENQDDLPF